MWKKIIIIIFTVIIIFKDGTNPLKGQWVAIHKDAGLVVIHTKLDHRGAGAGIKYTIPIENVLYIIEE